MTGDAKGQACPRPQVAAVLRTDKALKEEGGKEKYQPVWPQRREMRALRTSNGVIGKNGRLLTTQMNILPVETVVRQTALCVSAMIDRAGSREFGSPAYYRRKDRRCIG